MVKRISNILWIDRWKKYVWLAYIVGDTSVVMPIWYIINNWTMFYELNDILNRYNINKIIVWYPQRQKDIQDNINNFIIQISQIVSDKVEIERFDEDYSSVEAEAKIWKFSKSHEVDTLAAMNILERYLNKNLKE